MNPILPIDSLEQTFNQVRQEIENKKETSIFTKSQIEEIRNNK